MRFFPLLAILICPAVVGFGGERATLTGIVIGVNGKPLDDASVMVYQAGVKKGYNTFCPTCYVDCGKRTITDRNGSFTISSLDPDLWFDLLIVRENYKPTFLRRLYPSTDPIAAATLDPRPAVSDPDRVVKGRVVDAQGKPLRSAIITPRGVNGELEGHGIVSMYGTIEGLEPVAVSNSQGEFELSYSRKATGMVLHIEARGMAPLLIAAPTGKQRTTIPVSEGAVIRGRLVDHGKPVPDAEMGLIAQERGGFGAQLTIIGNPFDEIRIGTQPDGTFVIPNVPAPVKWYVYGEMASIAALGTTNAVEASTIRNSQLVDVGDIEVHPGHRLRGRILLEDGFPIGEGMRVTITADRVWDHQTAIIGRDGNFEFTGLPNGKYEILPSVRRYHLHNGEMTVRVTVDQDIDDLVIALERAAR